MDRDPSGYDALAWFYDRCWGCRFHDAARPALERLLYSTLPAGARVLELCCGSGHLTGELIARGCRVIGIDESFEMLRYARRRAPAARLVCADAARCSFQCGVCDAAVSTFDSINHLITAASLECAFRFVAGALRRRGLFVFDVNTEPAYLSEWDKSSAIVAPDAALFLRGGYDRVSRLGRTSITAFRRDGEAWHRTDVEMAQRCYGEGELSVLLAAAGFGEIAVCPADRAGMTGDMAVGRVFVSARNR